MRAAGRPGAAARSTRSRRSPGIAFAEPERPGRAATRRAGRPIRGPRRAPLPAWDLVDLERYRRDLAASATAASRSTWSTTRGCPYHCNWCAKPHLGPALQRAQPGERGRRAGAGSSAHAGPDHIWFADDIMGLKPGWLPRFADLRRGAGRDACRSSAWAGRTCCCAPGTSRRWPAPAARSSGSAPSRARRGSSTRWRRAPRVEQIREAARAAARRRHRGRVLPPVRLPGRDPRGRSRRPFAWSGLPAPTTSACRVSYPLPGTPFHARVQGAAGRQAELGRLRGPRDALRGPFTTAFYRALHDVVHAEFRARAARAASCSGRRGTRAGCGRATRAAGGRVALAPGAAAARCGGGWTGSAVAARHRASGRCGPGLGHDAAATPVAPARVRRVSARPRDLLLTHGYCLVEDPHELAVMKPYPPLGILYLSSHLKAQGLRGRGASTPRSDPRRASSAASTSCGRRCVGIYMQPDDPRERAAT